ncbi:MAG: hypothetical protein D3914_12945 [Candidatus Electrothrix sp. LOE2]|nr:hypothetical protein [Candidatus Electrothrix sp. LOE2]
MEKQALPVSGVLMPADPKASTLPCVHSPLPKQGIPTIAGKRIIFQDHFIFIVASVASRQAGRGNNSRQRTGVRVRIRGAVQIVQLSQLFFPFPVS